MADKSTQIVYVLTNPAMPGCPADSGATDRSLRVGQARGQGGQASAAGEVMRREQMKTIFNCRQSN